MVASESLFLLIKSLNKNEKRYFRLSANKYSFKNKNNYLKLFDEIERQTVYDEQKLKERNKKESFVNNLAVEKHNLYKIILKSLSNYYKAKPIKLKIKEYIGFAEILLQKSLFADYEKQLLKAKRLAYKYEKWLYVLEIITMQRKLTREGVVNTPLGKWMEEEENVLGILSCEYELRKVNSQSSDIIKKSLIRDKELLAQLKKLLEHPLITGNDTNLSFTAKRYKYNTLIFIHRVLSNNENNYKYAVAAEELFFKHPHFTEENPNTYLSTLTNRIIAEAGMIKINDASYSLEKLKKFGEKHRNTLSEADYHNNLLAYYALTFELVRYSHEFEKTKKMLPEMKLWLVSCKHLLDKQNVSVLYLSAGNLCFMLGDYKGSSKWIMEIIKDTDIKNYRDDVQCFARIINVINQYKTDNIKQLPKIIKSTFRFLLRKKKLYRVEICIMNFIKNKMPRKKAKHAIKLKFKELKSELEEILKDKNEKKVLAYFDFISWLESEITGIPMIDIVKKNMPKTN